MLLLARDLLYLVTFVKTTKKIAPESYFRPEARYCFQIPDLAQAKALELSYIYISGITKCGSVNYRNR